MGIALGSNEFVGSVEIDGSSEGSSLKLGSTLMLGSTEVVGCVLGSVYKVAAEGAEENRVRKGIKEKFEKK